MDWDHRYACGDTPWDKGRAHPLIATRACEWHNHSHRHILVPGCGTGHDAAAIATALPGSHVTAIDLSRRALDAARKLGGDLPNLSLIEANALQWQPAQPFDLVWEHTFFCALHPRQRPEYLQACRRWLRPGGLLHGAFFTHLDDENDGPPWNCPSAELSALLRHAFEPPTIHPNTRTFAERDDAESEVIARRSAHPES